MKNETESLNFLSCLATSVIRIDAIVLTIIHAYVLMFLQLSVIRNMRADQM